MRKIVLLGGLFLSLLVFLNSCTKELLPPNVIDGTKSLSSKNDVWAWSNGFMASFRASNNGLYVLDTEFQADMLNATKGFGNRGGTFHSWKSMSSGEQDIETMFGDYYTRIGNTNFFLDNIGAFVPKSDGERDTVAYATATAYFFRAYYYTELANRWSRCKFDGDELCVPLTLKTDFNAKLPRATQKEVYESIKSDLSKAEEELGKIVKTVGQISNLEGLPQASYLTKDIVKALKARAALYFEDYPTALAEAKSLIDGGRYVLLTNAAQYQAMWHQDGASTEVLMMLHADNNLEAPNTMSVLINENTSQPQPYPCAPDFMPSQWVMDLYDAADIRKAVFFREADIILTATTKAKGWIVNKYPGASKLNTTEKSKNYRHQPKPFRLAELYLIAAEAAYKTSAYADALANLNALRVARGLAASTASGDALFTEIQNERARELAFEGFRLTDLRRWGRSMKRRAPQDMKFLNPNYTALEFANDAFQFVWPIPNASIQANSNLVQNPGW